MPTVSNLNSAISAGIPGLEKLVPRIYPLCSGKMEFPEWLGVAMYSLLQSTFPEESVFTSIVGQNKLPKIVAYPVRIYPLSPVWLTEYPPSSLEPP